MNAYTMVTLAIVGSNSIRETWDMLKQPHVVGNVKTMQPITSF